MTITKEMAKDKIQKLRKTVGRLGVNPDSFTYVEIYKSVLELFAQDKYTQAFSIANITAMMMNEDYAEKSSSENEQ